MYEIPSEDSPENLKRKLTGVASINEDQPAAKIAKELSEAKGTKRMADTMLVNDGDVKKPRTADGDNNNNNNNNNVASNRRRKSKVWFPVNEQWQRNVCQQFGLKFVSYNGATPGGPDVPLGHCVKTRKIYGDGNCMFRSFAKLITGSPGEQLKVRKLIIDHMVKIGDKLVNSGYIHDRQYPNVTAYINGTKMNIDHVWGTDVEIMTLAHMLKICIYSYYNNQQQWARFDPSTIDLALTNNVSQMSMYLFYKNNNHFDVVLEAGDPAMLRDNQMFDIMMIPY